MRKFGIVSLLSFLSLVPFPVLLFLCALPAEAQTPTLVSGTITDANGVPYSFAKVSAQLIPTTASPTIIVNGIPTQIGGQQNANADANGAFTMNLFCNSAGGGCSVISPSGTQWQITVNENGSPPPIGTGPQTCSATVTVTGATQSVTASFAACPSLGKGPLSGVFTGPATFANINKVVYADQQAGATADVKITNCLAALPSGGICDATGFGATTQSIAATVTVPSGIWLRAALSTKFQPSSSGVFMFQVSPGAVITGIHADLSNLTANTWTASVFSFNGNYVDGQFTLLENFLISASTQNASGEGVLMQATDSTTQRIAFVTVRHGRIFGTNSGLLLTTTGTGWINGNTFDDIEISANGTPGNGFFFSANGSVGINANLFTNCSFEGAASTTGTGLGMSGTAPIKSNSFLNLDLWDTTVAPPFSITNTNAIQNFFQGHFEGTVADGSGGNDFINLFGSSLISNSLKLAQRSTLTLKKGSGAGNYTNATTSYTVADATNLCYTVTIPTGWKLGVSASGALSTATAAVVAQAALTDNAACSTANAGILVETAPIQGAAIGVADAFSLDWVITGDGAAHNIALQFKTSNAADAASLINSSATVTPTMKFELMPSN